MKKTIILILLAIAVIRANSQQMQFSWVNQIGGSGWDVLSNMKMLNDSQLVITGGYYNKILFSGDTLFSKGSRDVFIANYLLDGRLKKAISLGGPGYDYVKMVEADTKNNLVMPIQFNQELQIGNKKYSSKFLNNILVGWFNKSLDLTANAIISSNKEFDLTSLKSTSDGDFCFSGWFTDTLVVEDKEYITSGGKDIFLGRISPNGKMKWFKHFEGEGEDLPASLSMDKDSMFYLSGLSSKGYGAKKRLFKTIPKEMTHLFISQISSTGRENDTDFPLFGYDLEPVDMMTDSSSVWVLLNFKYSVFVNTTRIDSKGQSDVLLIKYDRDNRSLLYYQLGGDGNEKASGLAKSGAHLIVTGLFTDKLNFADKKLVPGEQGSDVFIVSFNNDCQPESILPITGDGSEFPCSVLTNQSGIYLAGEFTGTLKAGSFEFESKGEEDLFLARVENCSLKKPIEILVKALVDAPSEPSWELDAGPGYVSYSWNDSISFSRYFTTTQPGSYQVTVTDTLGCNCKGKIVLSDAKNKSAKINPDKEEIHEYRLYPTISSNLVNWEPASLWKNKSAVVRIFDSAGNLIDTQEISELNKSIYQISFKGRPEGIYLVNVSGSDFREISKVVVRK